MKLIRLSILVTCTYILSSCTASKKITAASGITGLNLLNEYVVPNGLLLNQTVIGGLSGIDHDVKNDLYYMISDDRSDRNPARFYTAKIDINNNEIRNITFINADTLRNEQGKSYPNRKTDSLHTPDPESIRFDSVNNQLVWSSEGDRIVDRGILIDPAIYITDTNGRYKDKFEIPANLHVYPVEKGARQNGVFEGLAFSDDHKYLFASVEEPLYEDGPRAGSGDSSAWVRILKFNVNTKKQVAQYAYRVEPLAFPPDPPGAFRINGISEIFNVGNNKLIVMERSFSTGRSANTIRLFLVDPEKAEDISSVVSLKTTPPKKPLVKTLLLDMDKLYRYTDNIEGITFGPVLSNGHRSLILVADNNFDNNEKMQFFLLEILPK